MTISGVRDHRQAMRHIIHIGNHQIPVDGTIENSGLDSVDRLGVFLTLAGELNEAQRRELLSVAQAGDRGEDQNLYGFRVTS